MMQSVPMTLILGNGFPGHLAYALSPVDHDEANVDNHGVSSN
jgi:hypothetical protein